jgi:predicted permease
MIILPAVLDVVVPVFGVVALGYLVGAFRWLDSAAVRGLSLYVFNIAIPLLLFQAMATVTLPEFIPWRYLLAYYSCALGFFLACLGLGWRLMKQPLSEASVFAFGCSYGNFIPLGIPLVLTAFGDRATTPLFLMVALQAPLFFPLMIFLQESVRRGSGHSTSGYPVLKSIFANQYLIGIGLGIALNLVDFAMPAPITDIIDLIGRSAVPCALFALGASLSSYPIGGVLGRVALMVVIKNGLFPLVVWWVAAYGLDLAPLWQAVMVLMAALPVGINTYLFAERYQSGVALGGSGVVLSTAVSIVTISFILSMLAV